MKSETKKLVQFDWAIKTLLRQKANFPILAGFLSELLDTDVTIESLLESESNKSHSKDKSNRVDVLAQLGNGEKVIIEVRCERQWDFLDHARTSTHRASCGVASGARILECHTYTPVLRAGDSWQDISISEFGTWSTSYYCRNHLFECYS